VRLDGQEDLGTHPFSPQVSAAVRTFRNTELQFGFGRYVQTQFPSFPAAGSCLPDEQVLQRSNQYTAGVEQRFGENTRIRLQAFDRQSNDLVFVSNIPPCSSGGFLPSGSSFRRNYSRGAQVVVQRRSANRLSGWVGYTLVYARQSDLFTSGNSSLFSPYFVGSEDQRHSVNGFASYRLRPTINLSAKVLYGSGFPVSGGLENGPGGQPRPAPVVRPEPYFRLDPRADKCWAFTRWKLTLYGEVLNLTDHNNRIMTSTTFLPSGQLVSHTLRALPITPTAGLVFEF